MVFQILENIDPFYFIVAFSIGVFISYVLAPPPQIVIQYPTPENAGKITYQDDAGVCYKYRKVNVQCPTDKTKLKKLTLQH